MAAWVNTSFLAQDDREKYSLKNKKVAVDVLNVLNGVRYHL